MAKKRIDMKQFINEIEGVVEEGSEDTLNWLAEETSAITEWKLIQTAKNSRGDALSFIVFTTSDGENFTLPLISENVSDLIQTMITSTPNLDPESVPYVPDKRNFWRRYKKQIIVFISFLALFAAASITSLIVSIQNAGVAS